MGHPNMGNPKYNHIEIDYLSETTKQKSTNYLAGAALEEAWRDKFFANFEVIRKIPHFCAMDSGLSPWIEIPNVDTLFSEVHKVNDNHIESV